MQPAFAVDFKIWKDFKLNKDLVLTKQSVVGDGGRVHPVKLETALNSTMTSIFFTGQ